MAYTIKVTERFKAIHHIQGIVETPHDHDWIIELQLYVTALVPPGISINYFEIKQRLKQLLPDSEKCLNDVFDFEPTAENLSKYYYEVLKPVFPALQTVAVGEFPEFMCYYQP